MYNADMSADLDNQPYDNVEFPVRRPPQPSGTWPGPGASHTPNFKVNMSHGQSKGYGLAPVVEGGEGLTEEDEAEIPYAEDQRQNVSQSQTTTTTTVRESPVPMTPPRTTKANHVAPATKTESQSNATKSSQSATKSPTKQSSKTRPSPSRDSKASFVVDQPKPEEFTWNSLSPKSQEVFDTAYTRHKYFYKFTDRVLKQGNRLKAGVCDVLGKPGETMTYEQLMQGVLVDGEKLLLGGGWLYFRTVEFYDPDCSKQVKPPVGEGRICLTSLRLLILSAEMSSDAKLTEFGDPCEKEGGYKLEVSKLNNIYFQNIPLDCFESVELSSTVGTAADTKLTQKPPMCCGLFSCIGGRCDYSWSATPPLPMNISRRTIRLGVYLPPWRTPAIMTVHLHSKMSLTAARDFVAQIQNYVPQMQYHPNRVPTVL